MGIFDGCLLACDIDGTLLINDCIPQQNIEKIKYFVSEGGNFALATGRTAGAVSAVTRQIDCIGPSIVANGSMIFDFINDTALYSVSVPEDDKHIVKAVIDGCETVGVEAHSGKKVLAINSNQESIDHQEYEDLDVIQISYKDALKYEWNKVIYLFANEHESKTVKQIVSQFEHNSQFVDTSAVIYGRRRYYYEHVPCGVSKATTLKTLCEMLKIKKGCCYAIGDYYNDLEMIKAADIGAALADSPDEVKAVADKVVCDVQNGAVADFIDYLTERKLNNGSKF
ncbi:MAG: HAD-IIB family hydrolase [Ruminococcaceae bacterium]|nr:HAD-IIB family hydrolase [Oscillospiraceae bacterium]